MPAKESVGGWTVDDIKSTVRDHFGVGWSYDLPPDVRFVQGVVKVVRSREANDSTGRDPKELSVFLLAPEAPTELKRHPMINDGQTVVAGHVWFVNEPVMSGRCQRLSVEEPDAVFRHITDELALGDVPAVVVDPRSGDTALRFYPVGLDDPDECVLLHMTSSDIDLNAICDVIDRVYKQCLITPAIQTSGSLWEEASKYWPDKRAEERVQGYLKPAFAGAFASCEVRVEMEGAMGRVDVFLVERLGQGEVQYVAVLELKVLRSFSSTGSSYSEKQMKDHVEDGVVQAGMYRKEREPRTAALCCFDMREEDTDRQCFDHVKELAEKLQVALRRWYIYSSAKKAREAGAKLATG